MPLAYGSTVLADTYIGQLAEYMSHFKLRYVFLSNYQELMLLRQRQIADGVAILEHSPVFHARTRSIDYQTSQISGDTVHYVSLKEALAFLVYASKAHCEREGPLRHVDKDWFRKRAMTRTDTAGRNIGSLPSQSSSKSPGKGPFGAARDRGN